MTASWEQCVKDNFKKHVHREEVAREMIMQRMREELKDKERKIAQLRENEEFSQLKSALLVKHPDVLKLESYAQFLRNVTQSMKDVHSRKGKIVRGSDGKEKSGHIAERKLFGHPTIGSRKSVLVLRKNISKEEKSDVFEDLVEFYSHDKIQGGSHEQREGCFLERFAKSAIMEGLKRKNFAIRNIRIVPFCGTTLDINFGVDAVLIIEDNDGEKTNIYIDLKTCYTGSDEKCYSNEGKFADVALVVETDDGRIDETSDFNTRNIMKMVCNCIEIYSQKCVEKMRSGTQEGGA